MWAAAGLARLLFVALLAATPAIAAPSAPAPAPEPAPGVTRAGAYWMQIESRIESGYFQQDAAGLTALAAALPADRTAGDAND
ncbi:MAG: hypothetical protein ACRETJ_06765, partial [Steroidobacteraceae bacterium]